MNFDEYGKKARAAVKAAKEYVERKFSPEIASETKGTVKTGTAQTLKDAPNKAADYIKNLGK